MELEKLSMPDFATASVEEMLKYMKYRNFRLETSESGYMCFEADSVEPGCHRYSGVYNPLQSAPVNSIEEDLRYFVARTCVWALWQDAYNKNVVDLEILKWENYWLIPVPE